MVCVCVCKNQVIVVCVGEWVVCVGNSDQYVILFSKSPENVFEKHSFTSSNWPCTPQHTTPVHITPNTPSHWFFMLDYIAIDSRSREIILY